jgi:hypothetical protein
MLSGLAIAAVLAAGAATAEDDGPRPTDCPPKPKEYCLNSWKPKPVNPFESGSAAKKKFAAPSPSQKKKSFKANRKKAAK